MYGTVLNIHSWMRWLVIGLALWTILRAAMSAGRPWTPADTRSLKFYTIALDVQLLLGLLLYFALSPFTKQAMSAMGEAMKHAALRFWAVEHVVGMVAGIALAHIGAVKVRKATVDARKHRLSLIFVGLSLLVIFLTIPWPGTPAGRPLFRIY